MKYFLSFLFYLCTYQHVCAQTAPDISIYMLGITQDGGYPHAGCEKPCCAPAWKIDSLRRNVVSFALMDYKSNKWWLFEITPDLRFQLNLFHRTHPNFNYLPDGIFITHAHIGHYSGLLQLGKEVMNTKGIPVYILPKMADFLEKNGPWNQLITINNIIIHRLSITEPLILNNDISIISFTVPHRDEYSETAGFKIITPFKKYLFIPDINKWEKWNKNIVDEVAQVDIALLDATFYNTDELPNRNIQDVPHPTVKSTMMLFSSKSKDIKSKIYFIHMNHTNPLLWDPATQIEVYKNGFNFARQGMTL